MPNTIEIVPFTDAAAETFAKLRSNRVRIASTDLKIASIAITNNATLLTANTHDFERVPGLGWGQRKRRDKTGLELGMKESYREDRETLIARTGRPYQFPTKASNPRWNDQRTLMAVMLMCTLLGSRMDA